MQSLQQLKSFDAQQHSIEELMALLSFGAAMLSAYKEMDMETPEWLTDAVVKLKSEITLRSKETLERELREIQGRREALKSAEEKRKDLEEKEKRILAKLGR